MSIYFVSRLQLAFLDLVIILCEHYSVEHQREAEFVVNYCYSVHFMCFLIIRVLCILMHPYVFPVHVHVVHPYSQ